MCVCVLCVCVCVCVRTCQKHNLSGQSGLRQEDDRRNWEKNGRDTHSGSRA